MGTTQWIVLAIIGVIVIYAIMVYNGLVLVKNAVSKAWANIDVLLKQRHDELPKLVETCKQYKQFEAETLEKVTTARARVQSAREQTNVGALGPAEGALRSAVNGIFATVEAYPELKANENFIQLQNRITSLENAISDRRELYNDSVYINNVRIETFPDLIIARIAAFGPAKLLEFDSAEITDVDLKKIFA